MKGKNLSSLGLLRECCRALDAKKAADLRVLDVRQQSSITDYLVIATGTSEPHLRALRVELEKAIATSHTHVVGREAAQQSGWIIVDAFDVMIHIFLPDVRAHYGLENLWKDAVEVPVAKLLAAPRRRAAGTKPRKVAPRSKSRA